MKTITFKTKQLLAALLCILCIPASAQFTQTLEQYPKSDYSTVTAQFSLTSVAEALSTDAETLAAALDTWYENYGEDTAVEDMFFLTSATDPTVTYTEYTQGSPGGYWVSTEGEPMGWGEGCGWYNELAWDTEDDVFVIYLGQYPGAYTEGGSATPHFVLKYNGKEVTFNITYTILPTPDAPEVLTTTISELNIVGETLVQATRTDIQSYDATVLSVDATDILAKLCLEAGPFEAQLPQIIYTEAYDTELGVRMDELTNETTAGVAPGWWFRRVMYPQGHEQQGELSNDLGAAGYSSDDYVFMEAFAYNPDENTITCNLGQYPGTPKAGDCVSAYIYLINGKDAFRIQYEVTFEEAPAAGLDEMTLVGNKDVDITCYDADADYQAYAITLDMEEIAAALGCTTDAINITTLKDEDALWVGTGTANNGGFWLDELGFACTWGDNARLCFEPTSSADFSEINVMLFPTVKENVGDTFRGTIYFINDVNYYTVNLSMTVDKKEIGDQSSWQVVDTRAAIVQVVASAEDFLAEQTTFTLTDAQISDALGTDNYVMYCATADTIAATGELYAAYSKYLCSPAPGIWFNANGQGAGWNGTQSVGVCWGASNGTFEVYQMPGTHEVGSTFTAPIYFVDEEAGKMLLVNFTVQFVDELKSAEIVGTENLLLPVSESFEDLFVDIDLEKPAAALGVTVDELLAAYCFKGMKSNGMYSDGVDPINMGLAFDLNGFYDDYGYIYVNITDDKTQLMISSNEEVEEDFRASATICFELNEQLYVYNVTFMSETEYANGVEAVKADAKAADGKIYDLSGRQVNNPTKKGIYIQNGKKIIIK